MPVTDTLPSITTLPDTENPDSSNSVILITLIVADSAVKLFAVKVSTKASPPDI